MSRWGPAFPRWLLQRGGLSGYGERVRGSALAAARGARRSRDVFVKDGFSCRDAESRRAGAERVAQGMAPALPCGCYSVLAFVILRACTQFCAGEGCLASLVMVTGKTPTFSASFAALLIACRDMEGGLLYLWRSLP